MVSCLRVQTTLFRCNLTTLHLKNRKNTGMFDPHSGGYLAQYKIHKENKSALCSLVVDSGYSFTHIIPYYNGRKILEGVKR